MNLVCVYLLFGLHSSCCGFACEVCHFTDASVVVLPLKDYKPPMSRKFSHGINTLEESWSLDSILIAQVRSMHIKS